MNRQYLLAMILAASTVCSAAPLQYIAQLAPVNGSGVSGVAQLTLDGNLLSVQIQATGLEPNMPHPQHIHGRVDAFGNPLPPLPPVDLDGDGFIETPEAVPAIGPPILPLSSPPGTMNFPTAPGGSINFSQTYDLSDPTIFSPGFDASDLLPLSQRTLEIHGRTLGPVGLDGGEANGQPGYKMDLPVASGAIQAVPEPVSMALAGFGLTLLYGISRIRPRPSR